MIRRHITPALIAFTCLLAGCLAAAVVGGSWWLTAAVGLVCAAVSVVFLHAPSFFRAGTLFLCAAAGFLLGAVSQVRMLDDGVRSFLPMPETDVSGFAGTVVRDSTLTRDGDTVLVLAMRTAASAHRGITAAARGNVLLFVAGDSRFSIGERLEVRARPTRKDGFGAETWTASARRTDIHAAGFSGAAWAFRADARAWLHRAVSEAGFPASALLEALLVGSREDVPRDLEEGFKLTGSLHILALSGLHVTVLYGLAAGALWFLRRKWLQFAAAACVILFFQFLAGFMPSLLRATVMILVGGTAALLDRDREPLNLLALSGIVLLLIDPWQVFSLSFQLSFCALAGILAVGALVQRPLAGKLPRVLVAAIAMSVGAQAATMPLVIARFGAWYPSGLVAGIVLVPLTTAYLWAGLVWLPISLVPWPLLHDACARGFGLFYEVIRQCAVILARVPGLSFPGQVIPWLAAGTALAALAAAMVFPLRQPALRDGA